MGLFALRKGDHSSASRSRAESRAEASASGPSDRSVAQLIRARFNGRKKRQANLSQSSYATEMASVDPSSLPSLRPLEETYTSQPQDTRSEQAPRHPSQSRTSSDVVTVTLAHKLNELATAHKEGVLNDDDYRVLRQNLFNSFASHSTPPVEAPIVKSVEPVSLRLSTTSRDDCSTINSARPPSLHTQNTSRSSVSTLFRRLRRMSLRDNSVDEQDQLSILSTTPRMPLAPATISDVPALGRQASTTSLRTTRSRQIPPDLRSVSSKRSLRSTVTVSDVGGISRGSTRSLRTNDAPPSSFNSKFMTSRLPSLDGNGDRLRSAADIRDAIRSVEAEQQSVLASLFLLSQSQFCPVPPSLIQPQIRIQTYPGTSSDSNHGCGQFAPGSHALSDETSWMNQVGGVSIELIELERRRAEINLRYQQRLDYLKARLKGAEIHERILRK